jgi:hypothetical protein
MQQRIGEPYQPSNGTEGMYFTDKYCMNCLHFDPNPDGKKQCEILCASMCFSINEEGYPKEWVYDANNKPSCTSWQKWDWGKDGDLDNPKKPKVPIVDDPNQLCMPFIFDEMGIVINKEELV